MFTKKVTKHHARMRNFRRAANKGRIPVLVITLVVIAVTIALSTSPSIEQFVANFFNP